MPIDTFSVTVDDVLGVISGVDTRYIQQSSGRVSKDKIDGWIEDIASDFAGMLEGAAELDASDLEDEALNQIQRGIKHGAAAQALQKFGHVGDLYTEHQDIYESVRDRLEDKPQRLDRRVSQADSTIDTTSPDSEFKGTDFKL